MLELRDRRRPVLLAWWQCPPGSPETRAAASRAGGTTAGPGQANAEQQNAWTAAGDRPNRLAEELIIGAMHDANEVLQLIKAQVVAGVSPALTLPMLGEWADRAARIGKVVTDGQLQERLSGRVRALDERKAQEIAAVMKHTLAAIDPTDQQLALFGPAMIAAMSSPDIEPVSLNEFMTWLADARTRVRCAEEPAA